MRTEIINILSCIMLAHIKTCAAGYTLSRIYIYNVSSASFNCNISAHAAAYFDAPVTANTIIVSFYKSHTEPPLLV